MDCRQRRNMTKGLIKRRDLTHRTLYHPVYRQYERRTWSQEQGRQQADAPGALFGL